MINIIEIPQRSDNVITFKTNKNVLTVTLNGVEEVFDFTQFGEGIAEEIEIENISLNPIIKAEKIGDIFNIEVLRFYSYEEKELFENGYN